MIPINMNPNVNSDLSVTQIMKTLKSMYGHLFQDPSVTDGYREMMRDAVASTEKKLMMLEDDGK